MSSSRSTLLRWPFWLLIAAWVCANTPQVAAWHVIVWVKNAQHFSHQARLRVEVASLLTGKPAAEPARLVAPTDAEKSPPPAPPADFAVKKILLSLVFESGFAAPPAASRSWPEVRLQGVLSPVGDVPLPPPRA